MRTKIIAVLAVFLAIFSGCEKDGDLVTVTGLNSPGFMVSDTSIVLTKEAAASYALALTWSESNLTISDGSMRIPSSVPGYAIEVSSTASFDSIAEYVLDTTFYSFTVAALNTLGKNLGCVVGVSSPLYFRVKTYLGENTSSKYSNVVRVMVTCYNIDMSIGFILDAGKSDTGFKLYSPDSDGEYFGFTYAAGWYNWFLLEGDGTIWGNVGVAGNAFKLSSDESNQWNFWYPGNGGCYYTTLSTTSKEWTATLIPSLSISGDVTATMSFDKTTVKWYASITTTTSNAKVKVSCDAAKLYNYTTSTEDASALSKTLGIIPAADSTFSIDWNSANAGEITIPVAGTYTLSFYLADPTNWTYQITSGSAPVVEHISDKLYLMGIDDDISGSWTFDNYLKLLSEDDSTFVGVIQVDSKFGYQMALETGEWTNVYKMGSTEGTLSYITGNNITAPDSGLYLMQADLQNLTYSNMKLGDSIFIGGLNGNIWDFTSVILTQTSSGVYQGTVNYTTASEWGMKIYLKKDDWSNYFSGTFSSLVFKGSNNITDVKSLALGTYNVSVDLKNGTCSFVAK